MSETIEFFPGCLGTFVAEENQYLRFEQGPSATVALEWATEVNGKSPTAQRMLKFAFNLPDDGLVGQQLFAGEATRLAYGTNEAVEGRDAFLEKRDAAWDKFPWHY